ncbi:MAG TPA: hypothetical protein VFY38_08055, partial [Pseudonocardia sp.]|nr:hypothetical protein [Pseudonocardia sp.]
MRHHRHPAGMPPFPPANAAAFADGRRLREESYRRRRVAGRPGGHPHLRPRGRALLAIAAVIVMLTIASDGGVLVIGGGMLIVLVTLAWIIVLMAAPLLLVGGIVFAVTRSQRRALRHGGAAGTAPLPARPAAPPRPDLIWAHARRRFGALRSAYAAYECDPMAVLRLPALAD